MVLSNTHTVTHMSTGFVSFKLCQSSLEPWFDVPCRLQRPTRTVFKATIFVIYPYLWKHHPTNIWMKKDRSIDGQYDVAFCLYPQGRFEFFFLHGLILFLDFACHHRSRFIDASPAIFNRLRRLLDNSA